jgi:hypothetical protein
MQLTDVLQFVEATLDRISPARAQELAKQMASGEGREQVAKAAQELIDWSQKNRDRVRALVQREVTAQLSAMGIATKDDYDALERRIAGLERTSRKRTTAKRAPAKRTTAKRTTGGRPASGRTAAKDTTSATTPAATSAEKKLAAKKPAAKPADAEKAPSRGESPAETRTAATRSPRIPGGSESTPGG